MKENLKKEYIKEKYDENGNIICDGDFENRKYNGKGKEFFINGKIKYEGYFKNGGYEMGKLYYENGNIKYEGYFNYDDVDDYHYHGKGKLYYKNGKIKYEGDFKDSEYNGKGKLYYENGNIKYEGNFCDGMYKGEGILYKPDGTIEYSGKFEFGDTDGLFYIKDGCIIF